MDSANDSHLMDSKLGTTLLPSSYLAQDLGCAVNVDGEWNRCQIINFYLKNGQSLLDER